MRAILPVLLFCLATPAMAETAAHKAHPHRAATTAAAHTASHGEAPVPIGSFGAWQAATYKEAGQTVCYAFTRATSSTPALHGRGDVVLTVTDRPGGLHDAVAISAGFTYPRNAQVPVQIGATKLSFYTAQRSAFARDGRAAAAAFAKASQAVARSPGPHGKDVLDTFSLQGFGPAYAAMDKACAAH
jgi:Invasion associated locus B (IalB) protein